MVGPSKISVFVLLADVHNQFTENVLPYIFHIFGAVRPWNERYTMYAWMMTKRHVQENKRGREQIRKS